MTGENALALSLLKITAQHFLEQNVTFLILGENNLRRVSELSETERWLQALVNSSECLDHTYAVFNLGARGNPRFVDFYKLLQLTISPGDIVIYHGVDQDVVAAMTDFTSSQFIAMNPDYSDRHRRGEIFFDAGHVTYKGHAIVAEQLFNRLFLGWNTVKPIAQTILTDGEKSSALAQLATYSRAFTALHSNLDKHPDLQHYVDELKPLRPNADTVGAVVVNCNPFTLGHRFLIEHAASRVDHLFVFVVEEDLSYFRFSERFAMVANGTEDIANVTVIRSGNYIMSTITYPDYFCKEEAGEAALDASMDMDIFGEYIAPVLNICVRFIGEEPGCNVTRQHNTQMRTILPTYGIRVEEVKRIAYQSEAISASRVRRYIKSRGFDAIRPLLPPSTYSYLSEKYREHDFT